MAEQGFLAQRPRSPGSLAIVIALHGAAIGALMMAKSEAVVEVYKSLKVRNIPIPPEPPPPPEIKPQPKVQPQAPSRIDTVQPIIKPPVFSDIVIADPKPADPVVFDTRPVGPVIVDPPVQPQPKPEPVRTEARIDPRSRLQPPYPAAEERAEVTGSVTVVVVIGTDGRVRSVQKVSAASEAFFRATEQQALRHWRFKPATVDGKPVESRKTMTVHFRLDA